MYLIYYISDSGLRPIATCSTIRLTTEWIKENQYQYEKELRYSKINYIWR